MIDLTRGRTLWIENEPFAVPLLLQSSKNTTQKVHVTRWFRIHYPSERAIQVQQLKYLLHNMEACYFRSSLQTLETKWYFSSGISLYWRDLADEPV